MSEKIKIKLVDYYTEAVGDAEYVLVSEEVYEALTNTFRREAHAERMRDYRNRTAEGYIEGITEDLLMEEQISVEEQVISSLELNILQTAMQTLTETQKERLCLYFFEGLNYARIARKLGVSEHSVRTSIEGSIKKLKKFLA